MVKTGDLSADNRPSQAEFVCQRCGHTDNADHNAACGIAKRGIQKLLSGDPLTKAHKATRGFPRKNREDFRKLGSERSEVTLGEIGVSRLRPTASTQRSMSQETPASTRQG